MQVNTQVNQVAYAQYNKTQQTEGAKVQQQTQQAEKAQSQKTEAVQSTKVEKTQSTPTPAKVQKADTVEISQEAKKLYEASIKQKEAESVKAETVKVDEVQKQLIQSAEKPKEQVSEKVQNLVASVSASQATPVVRTDAQVPVKESSKDSGEKKVSASNEASKAK
jgi:hypothetical protein